MRSQMSSAPRPVSSRMAAAGKAAVAGATPPPSTRAAGAVAHHVTSPPVPTIASRTSATPASAAAASTLATAHAGAFSAAATRPPPVAAAPTGRPWGPPSPAMAAGMAAVARPPPPLALSGAWRASGTDFDAASDSALRQPLQSDSDRALNAVETHGSTSAVARARAGITASTPVLPHRPLSTHTTAHATLAAPFVPVIPFTVVTTPATAAAAAAATAAATAAAAAAVSASPPNTARSSARRRAREDLSVAITDPAGERAPPPPAPPPMQARGASPRLRTDAHAPPPPGTRLGSAGVGRGVLSATDAVPATARHPATARAPGPPAAAGEARARGRAGAKTPAAAASRATGAATPTAAVPGYAAPLSSRARRTAAPLARAAVTSRARAVAASPGPAAAAAAAAAPAAAASPAAVAGTASPPALGAAMSSWVVRRRAQELQRARVRPGKSPVTRTKRHAANGRDADAEAQQQLLDAFVGDSAAELELEDFTVIGLLGKGGFGRVMLVQHNTSAEQFAMKVLSKRAIIQSKYMKQAMEEKRILQQMDHPFVVKLHHVFQTRSNLFLLLTFAGGGDLHRHLKERQRVGEAEARFFLAETVLALEHLHRMNIAYRDLKPENILLGMDGHVLLTDFGLSKVLASSDDAVKHGGIVGTPAYMAPEVIRGEKYDKSIDWWTLGVLLYEMLTGQTPFKGDSTKERFHSILHADIEYPSHVTIEARSLMALLLVRNPERRLGHGEQGARAVRDHIFFAGVDWGAVLRKELPPPYVPTEHVPVDRADTEVTTEAEFIERGGREDFKWQREQRQFQRLWKLEANSMSPASPYAAPSAHAGASTGGAQSDASSDEQASGGGGGGGDDSTDSDGGYAAMAGLLHAEGEAELGGTFGGGTRAASAAEGIAVSASPLELLREQSAASAVVYVEASGTAAPGLQRRRSVTLLATNIVSSASAAALTDRGGGCGSDSAADSRGSSAVTNGGAAEAGLLAVPPLPDALKLRAMRRPSGLSIEHRAASDLIGGP